MTENEINDWLAKDLPRFETLTAIVVNVLKSLLTANGIDHLSVTGRTKSVEDIREKIRRKAYADPKKQLTDISGIRVILYFESQVERASKIIEKSFKVDKANSYNRDVALSIDQIGYRSVHYVCDLGGARTDLPENSHLFGLCFEIQLRTVLQHAWAELAHDRNYKFSEKLPRDIERELFLYAGMLEIADRGFDALSQKIDLYVTAIEAKTNTKDFDIEINSISLQQFVNVWADGVGFRLEPSSPKSNVSVLVEELTAYGLANIGQVQKIIPGQFATIAKELDYGTTIFGLIRDWMLLHDYKRYQDQAWDKRWSGFDSDEDEVRKSWELYRRIVGNKAAHRIFEIFNFAIDENYDQRP